MNCIRRSSINFLQAIKNRHKTPNNLGGDGMSMVRVIPSVIGKVVYGNDFSGKRLTSREVESAGFNIRGV